MSDPLSFSAASKAFSDQAPHFDLDDFLNPILKEWREQIYDHVSPYIKPEKYILELNSGTGIDALFFARIGNRVHATELSEGMIDELRKKVKQNGVGDRMTVQQVSYEELDQVTENNFDFAFSNFGGLNCTSELPLVTRHLKNKLKTGGFVTWVIMPRCCPWEWLWVFKGKWKDATRRFRKAGTIAHLEGNYFPTYYHSVADVRRAFGDSFELVRCEALGIVKSPPSATNFYKNHRSLYHYLRAFDKIVKDIFPFNRCGDHVIVTFQKK